MEKALGSAVDKVLQQALTADPIDRRILEMLAEGPRTEREMAARLPLDVDEVHRRCLRLQRAGVFPKDVALKHTTVTKLDVKICNRLTAEPVRTGDIARIFKLEPVRVYAVCRHLEFMGLAAQRNEKTADKLLFFPATGQVVNRNNYKDIEHVVAELQAIARQHPLPRGTQIPGSIKQQLRRDYHACLSRLQAKADDPAEQARLRAFEGELMGVLSGTKLRDVIAFTGVRVFHKTVATWARSDWRWDVGPQLPTLARHIPGDAAPFPGDVIWKLLCSQ